MSEAWLAAVAIALSPFAVIPAILLLFAPRPLPCSAGFASGWFAGVVLTTAVAVLLADTLTLPDVPPRWASWARLALGLALVVVGALTYLRRRPNAAPPRWIASLERATPREAVRFGLVSSALNPKVALLAVAGGFSLGAGLTVPAAEVAAVLAFSAVATCTAIAPATAFAVRGDRVLGPLGRAKDWLTGRSDLAVALVLVVLGALLSWKGWTAL